MNPTDRPSLSIVIPVYNSVSILEELVQRVASAARAAAFPFEIILVNDGSSDASWDRIQVLTANYPELFGLDLMTNYGQQNALLAGVEAAQGDIVVTLDDDLEQPPEMIPRVVEPVLHGHDLVFGAAKERPRSWFRNWASRGALSVFVRLNRHGVPTAPMRAFRRELCAAFPKTRSPFASLDVLLNWVVKNPLSVPIDYGPSRKGRSRSGFASLLTLLMNGITGMSIRPLQLTSYLGLSGLAGSLLLSAVFFGRWLASGIAPWPIGVAALLGAGFSFQCLAIGVLGEYVGRIYFSSLQIPLNLVRERTGTCLKRS